MVVMAPFETFQDHGARDNSGSPYNEAFIRKCREKALEYDKEDTILRAGLLQELKRCLPFHFRNRVFEGISNFDPV